MFKLKQKADGFWRNSWPGSEKCYVAKVIGSNGEWNEVYCLRKQKISRLATVLFVETDYPDHIPIIVKWTLYLSPDNNRKRPSLCNQLNEILFSPPKKLSPDTASNFQPEERPSPVSLISWQEMRSLLPPPLLGSYSWSSLQNTSSRYVKLTFLFTKWVVTLQSWGTLF